MLSPEAMRRGAVLAVVGLLVLPAVVGALWGPEPASPGQGRMPPGESPFPVFPRAFGLVVVPVPPTANTSTRLTLLSLQGLMNRQGAGVYLDFADERADPSSVLSFVVAHYALPTEVIDVGVALDRYLPGQSGLVVYDPGRPESVNVATTVAGIRGGVIAGPDTAEALARAYGLPILFDYAASDWSRLDPIGASERALAELYPQTTGRLLAILPPDRLPTRDYLVAANVFVFYHEQGALASPGDLRATARILRTAPRGIPILGWFRSPTLTEENAFVQLASREGKFVVGVQGVPNLSVLSALGRGSPWRQPAAPVGPVALADTTYAVVAVPDGDNLDFVGDRMRELWRDPARGSFPVAWSLNPILADLAPPLLAYFGTNATALDRFVAPPSGAGYLYPDYLGPGDLAPFLAFSGRYLNATGMDVSWLLNAFVANEISYRDDTLAAYARGLRPRGLVLDYADEPGAADYWMAEDVPVIRSTHLWTTEENFLAKVGAASAAWGPGPHFLWLTVYPWRYDLGDVRRVTATLSARLGGRLELVTPERFFALMEADFVARARRDIAAARGDPLQSWLLGSFVASAEGHLSAADAALAGGRPGDAASEAGLALRDLRSASAWEAVGLAFLAVVVAGGFALRRRRFDARTGLHRWQAPVSIATATALFFAAVRSTLEANFWTYGFLGLAAVGALLAIPLLNWLDPRYGRHTFRAAVLLDVTFAAFAVLTATAFPLAALGVVLVLAAVRRRERFAAESFVPSFLLGALLGYLGGANAFLMAGLAVPLVVVALQGPRTEGANRPRIRGGTLAALALVLPLAGLAPMSSYSLALRLGLQGVDLAITTACLLGLGCLLAGLLALRATGPVVWVRAASFALAALAAVALFAVRGTVPTALVLLVMDTALALAAIATLRTHAAGGRDLLAAIPAAVALAPLLLVALRMPPVAYSLVVFRFPEAVEFAWYAPQTLIAAVAAAGAALPVAWAAMRKSFWGHRNPGAEGRA